MNITIKPDKRYTVIELTETILEILNSIKPQLLLNERKFSPADVYWIITDVLRYINRIMDGEFRLRSIKKNNWKVVYIDEKAAKRKAKQEAKKQMKKAADYIEEITGKSPKWG